MGTVLFPSFLTVKSNKHFLPPPMEFEGGYVFTCVSLLVCLLVGLLKEMDLDKTYKNFTIRHGTVD